MAAAANPEYGDDSLLVGKTLPAFSRLYSLSGRKQDYIVELKKLMEIEQTNLI
jgi:hypothetical protein